MNTLLTVAIIVLGFSAAVAVAALAWALVRLHRVLNGLLADLLAASMVLDPNARSALAHSVLHRVQSRKPPAKIPEAKPSPRGVVFDEGATP